MKKVYLFIFFTFFFTLIASIALQNNLNTIAFFKWVQDWDYLERGVNMTYYNELSTIALNDLNKNNMYRNISLICYPIALIFLFLVIIYKHELEDGFIKKLLTFKLIPKTDIAEKKTLNTIQNTYSNVGG